jgi:hypothetical protein
MAAELNARPNRAQLLLLADSLSVLLKKIISVAFCLGVLRLLAAAGSFLVLCLSPLEALASVGIYLAVLNLTSLGGFGRFELLLLRAKDERQLGDSIFLCILTGCIATVFLLIALSAFPRLLPEGVPVVCFALGLASRLWLRLGLTIAARNGRYPRAAVAMFPHALLQPIILIALLKADCNPLFSFALADITGHIIAAAGVNWSERRSLAVLFNKENDFHRAWKLASSNFDLPTANLAASASAILFAMAPAAFIATMQNSALAGTLSLLFKALDLPTALIASSITPILVKEVTDRTRAGSSTRVRLAFLLPPLAAVSVFGCIAVSSVAFRDFAWVQPWAFAAAVVPVVALFQASIAAASPLIDIATAAGRHRGIFSVNVLSVVLAASALVIWSSQPVHALLIAAAIGGLRVLIMAGWLYLRTEGTGPEPIRQAYG